MHEEQTIGKRIRDIREEQSLSREQVAEKANISSQFLADIETNKKGMTVTTLKKLCDALQVSADSIVYGIENNEEQIFENIKKLLQSLSEDQKKKMYYIIKEIVEITQ